MIPNTPSQSIAITKSWIKGFVIKLGLCPFATDPFIHGKIHFEVCQSTNDMQQRLQLFDLVIKLESAGSNEISNAFLIYPTEVTFPTCLDIRDDVSELLKDYGLDEKFQLIVFHPQFHFAEGRQSSSNAVNQSPLPMIHILRQSEVNTALGQYADIEELLKQNDIKLRSSTQEKGDHDSST